MRRAMHEALSEEAMAETARMIQEKARAGDLAAARLLYAYGIGRPTPAVDPDQLDVQELRMHQQAATSPASLKAIVDAMPVTTALTLVRALLPVLEQTAAKQAVNVLQNGPPAADDDELDMELPEEAAPRRGSNKSQPPDDPIMDLSPDGPNMGLPRNMEVPSDAVDLEPPPNRELPPDGVDMGLPRDVLMSVLPRPSKTQGVPHVMELPEEDPAGLAAQDEMPGDRGGARQRRHRGHGRRRERQAERQQHQAELQAGEGSRSHKDRAPDTSGRRVPAPVGSTGSPPLDLGKGRPSDPPAATGRGRGTDGGALPDALAPPQAGTGMLDSSD